MLEVHEVLGRELDPIDDVCRRFELGYTGDYYNPLNGDWISDDYYRIIDLATQPGKLSEDEAGKLNRSIARLNSKYDYIQRLLGSSSLLGAYNSVASQVNEINLAEPNRDNIAEMQTAPIVEESA